ncbi:MAG: flocculation-associated PEP-CTERM protein PepA [Gammaproteobacteria bacterium]|nr:flocculation-associated PEP-CTERM protein PepA [Gammaproteobacteria bacterium]
MKSKVNVLTALLFTLGIAGSQAAGAAVLDAWKFDMSQLNGLALAGGGTVTGATQKQNIDHINVVGYSTVTQTVVGGSALGQPFTDTGWIQFNTVSPEGGGATSNLNYGTDGAGNDLVGYLYFSGITGTLLPTGDIKFDAGSGSIAFYLDNDGDLNPSTGSVLKVFEYSLIDPSGGSKLDFYGGTAANSTIDMTAVITYAVKPNILKDSVGNDVTTLTLNLLNTNSLLDPNYATNPDNSGVISGNGVSVIHVQNNGQYNLTTQPVPEPETLALLGLGFMAMGAMLRRRRTA